VVNHSLLLNDLVFDRMILGAYSYAIIDEAHALEEAARSAFTCSLSERHVERAADELVPSRRRRPGWLSRLDVPADGDLVRRATDRVATLRTTSARLFAVLARKLPDDPRGGLPDLEPEAASALERLRVSTDGVEESILDLIDGIDESEERREGEVHLASIRDLGGLAARLAAGPEDDTVRWYERETGGVALHITPLEVAPILSRLLYPALDGVVLTSATLSVEGDFGYVLRSLGVGEAFDAVETEIVGSPFSYERNMRVCVPRGFPLLTEDREGYVSRLVELVTAMADRLDRKGLVLFTSYEMLEAVRLRLPKRIKALAQGLDGPRSKILDRFRRTRKGLVLLGTDSFWEGVDLPGEELEYLVIARLPFAVPTDPIQAALGRLVAGAGGDPFVDLSLPRAVLRLRQGVGRLIRTQQDRGVAIVADRRILTRSYGRAFADSLPTRLEVFGETEELVKDLGAWFDEGSEVPPRLTRIDLTRPER
jgi:ATP-dependent DNA helicase DinG